MRANPYASWLSTYADSDFAEATRQAIGYVAEAAATANAVSRARMFSAFEKSAQHEFEFFAAPMQQDLRMPQYQR